MMDDRWREVSKTEFNAAIKHLDVTPWPMGRWQYTMEWKARDGRVLGKVVNTTDENRAVETSSYWLPR